MTDPRQPSESEQLEQDYEKGLISRQEYYTRKRALMSADESEGSRGTTYSVGASGPSVPTSASSVVGLGVVVLIVGAVLSGAYLNSPESPLLFLAGLIGVIVGTLLLAAGVIAYGVRVGVMQAYSKMGIPSETQGGGAQPPGTQEPTGGILRFFE
jgi:hypothetical protein